jgi:L-amino acid N-acyltransferase YncA/predicted O-methyltransferase YrrM
LSALMSSEIPRSTTAAIETVTIRDAVEEDLPAITRIYNDAVTTRTATAQLEPVGAGEAASWLKEHSPDRYPLWVLEMDGQIAGYLGLRPFLPRCAYRGTAEVSVYVDAKFQRRGVAKRLIEQVLSRAAVLGINALVALIFAHNEASLRLFGRFGFERWGVLPRIARLDSTERDLVIMGRPVSADIPPVGAEPRGCNDVFALMHTLMQYRHEPIHGELDKVRKKYSMLHLDVLLLIYHFAKTCSGQVLEIGAFLGGATIAAARGVRDSGKSKTLITIEVGGSLKHDRLGTKDIWRDLERNLARERVSELVTLLKGRSSDRSVVGAVEQALGANEIGLVILDADAAKRRDIESYSHKFASGCWMVIDDYYGVGPDNKIAVTRQDVDAMVATGLLEPLGFYGWSTWIGRWRAEALR